MQPYSLKVHLLFGVRAELAETFIIDVAFDYLEIWQRKTLNISMGQEIGVFLKWPLFQKYPDFRPHRTNCSGVFS